MKITDEMVRVARETFDNVSGSPLELATNDAWREALEAALAVDGVALQGWQPIESAPRDGTRILAFANRDGRPIMKVTWWRLPKDEAGYTGRGEFNEQFWPATHWQPLPPPPAASDREERR